MADNKLRLQIVTALDNAGIKATKEQIDSLNKSISNTSSSASGLNDVEKTIGKMEGPFGKLQELFDKSQSKISQFGTKALAVASAFKIGWDMGTWIHEHIVEPLFGITDPIEELKKKNEEIEKQSEAVEKEIESAPAAENKPEEAREPLETEENSF